MNFGRLMGGTVDAVISADQAFIDTLPDSADWVELPFGVWIGWTLAGAVWTGPDGEAPPAEPAPVTTYRYLLTGWEWVNLWDETEWDFLQTKRKDGTNAGKQLNRLMDAIRWTDSVNVRSDNMNPFYSWILANYPTDPAARVEALRQGVVDSAE